MNFVTVVLCLFIFVFWVGIGEYVGMEGGTESALIENRTRLLKTHICGGIQDMLRNIQKKGLLITVNWVFSRRIKK